MRRYLWAGLAFLATALVGFWSAYDRGAAGSRLTLLGASLAAALLVAIVSRHGGDRTVGALMLGCALVAALAGAYGLLMWEWRGSQTAAALHLGGLAGRIAAHRPVGALPFELDDNPVGALIAAACALGGYAVIWAWRSGQRALAVLALSGLVIGLAAMAARPMLGPALGLAAGALCGAACWLDPARFRRWAPPVVAGLALLLAGYQYVWMPYADGQAPLPAAVTARAGLWRDMSMLVRDYPLTGSGLANTTMVYSTYALLVQVPFMQHPHSLPLQVAIEQGLPGVAALAWLIVTALAALASRAPLARRSHRQSGETRFLTAGVLAALVTIVLNSVIDGGLYAGPLVPAFFLPFGLAAGLASRGNAVEPSPGRRSLRVAGVALAVVICTLMLLPSSRAMLHANLGAVSQTQAELGVYHWDRWPVQDAVRRSPEVNLAPAIAHYRAALALDAANEVANRRLGQIEVSQGSFDSGCRHIAEAYRMAPGRQPAAELLGECFAVDGRLEEAAQVWRGVERRQDQLVVRERWYAYLGDTQRMNRIAQAAALLN